MAVRSKKKDSLPQMSQKSEIMEDLIITAEPAQESFAGGDSELITADSASLTIDLSGFEQVANGSSEVNMSSDKEFPEGEASDTGMNEIVEPVINLDANLSIQNVVKFYEKVKKAYAAYDAIEIDASHVASVDTATLQLFVALKKDANKQQKKVDFFQPSDRFIESARLLDLLDILEITYV